MIVPVYKFRYDGTDETVLSPHTDEYGIFLFRGLRNDDILIWNSLNFDIEEIETYLIGLRIPVNRKSIGNRVLDLANLLECGYELDRLPILYPYKKYPVSWQVCDEIADVTEIIL